MKTCYGASPFRVSHYLPNGEGRDQYISSTNGGFFGNSYPFRFNDEARTQKSFHSKSVPKLDAKALKYSCDGSGRDTYIGTNHGGLSSDYKKFSFYNNLRTPTPGNYGRRANKKLVLSQKFSVKRLSIPKKYLFQ